MTIHQEEWEIVFAQYMKSMMPLWNQQYEEGVSMSQGMILEILRKRGKKNVSELSEHLGISLSAVTGLSDKLVKSKLVKRVRSSSDRRVVYLEATEKGLELSENISAKRKEAVTKIHSVLSEDEIQAMIDIYKKITKRMNS